MLHPRVRFTMPYLVLCCLIALTFAPRLVMGMMSTDTSNTALIVVSTVTDEYNTDGDCSLREAVIAANRNQAVDGCTAGTSIPDLILIPPGVYTLTLTGQNEDLGETGDLDVTGATIFQGAGNSVTAINGNRIDRVLDVIAGNSVNVQIRSMSLGNGLIAAFQNEGAGIRSTANLDLIAVNVGLNQGGGVRSDGSLEVISSTIAANGVGPIASGVDGGAGLSTSGSVTIENSLITGNTAFHLDDATSYGGGWLHRSGVATMHNSTVSGNGFSQWPSPLPDAGNGLGANIYSSGVLTITDSTIADSVITGKILNIPASLEGTVILRNSIVSEETGVTACAGNVQSLGYNISNLADCTNFTVEGDILDSDTINLGPLQDNGGSTFTRALEVGSSAIDTGTRLNCPEEDQRGVARPQDGNGDGSGACDRGAYEAGDGAPEPTGTPTPTPSPTLTPSATAMATNTPTGTPTPSATGVPPATVTPSVTPSATQSPLPTASATVAASVTPTFAPTVSPTGATQLLFLPLVMNQSSD